MYAIQSLLSTEQLLDTCKRKLGVRVKLTAVCHARSKSDQDMKHQVTLR